MRRSDTETKNSENQKPVDKAAADPRSRRRNDKERKMIESQKPAINPVDKAGAQATGSWSRGPSRGSNAGRQNIV